MNWPAIGAIAELLGAAGVIASLLYLARQIRKQCCGGATGCGGSGAYQDDDGLPANLSASSACRCVFTGEYGPYVPLATGGSPVSLRCCTASFRPYEELVYARRAGAVEEWVWDNGERSILPLLTTPGALEWWAKRKTWYTPALQAHIANILPAEAMESLGGIGKVAERQGLQGWRACRDERPGP